MRTTTILMVSALLAGGCSIHRLDIQQGNMVDAAQIEKVKVGMDRNQTRFVLGTPLIADVFHGNRWDYVYSMRSGDSSGTELKRFTVFFENDTVARVESTPGPTSEPSSH